MEKMWAPWRNVYITSKKKKAKCIFCANKKKKSSDREKHMLKRTKYAVSMLNRYPYNNGHAMVAPLRHVRSLGLLNKNELLDLMNLVNYTTKKIDKVLKPMGYNIGFNVGKIGGAGFPGHIHVHIVPRWQGDTNFMPVVSSTKVISASLDEMWKRLKG